MRNPAPTERARLAIRTRPAGRPIMQQHWGKLLFMHWRVPVAALRPYIPARLALDTYDGSAWLGLVPFTMWDIRLTGTPPVPRLSAFHETNVRTYVHLDGVPGVWFFSLDANSLPAVLGARATYHLPYFYAAIELAQTGPTIAYTLRRRAAANPTTLQATWTIGTPWPEAAPGSLDFFLTERYCLYAAAGPRLYRAHIHHPPWPLQRADLGVLQSSMFAARGLPTPTAAPLLHYAEALAVDIWPLRRV